MQVICNLVTNSIKFTPPGKSVSVKIKKLPEVEASPSIRSGGSFIPQRHHSKVVEEMDKIEAPAVEDYYREGTLLIEVVDTSFCIAHKPFSKVFGEFAQFGAQKLQANRNRSRYLRCCKFYSFIRSDGTLGWRWIGAGAMDQPGDSQASRKQDLLPLGWRRIRDHNLLRPTHLQESPPSESRHQSHREAGVPDPQWLGWSPTGDIWRSLSSQCL